MSNQPKVGCAGILVSDTFCGPMPALPRAGQLLAVGAMPTKPGGCAANVAICLAKQNISVGLAGCVGDDATGQTFIDSFAPHGIDVGRVAKVQGMRTSTTVILLVENQDRRYIHCFGANRAFSVSHLDPLWIKTLKVFYLGGLYVLPGIVMDELAELLAYCRAHGVITVVDVVIPDASATVEPIAPLLGNIDYFLPNEDEGRALTGQSNPREQARFFLDHGAKHVIVTRGTAGAVAGSAGGLLEVGVHRMQSIDPSGAGDAFTAGVITGVVRGWSLERSLQYAATLGASATRAVGTTDGVFAADEAERFVRDHPLAVSHLTLS